MSVDSTRSVRFLLSIFDRSTELFFWMEAMRPVCPPATSGSTANSTRGSVATVMRRRRRMRRRTLEAPSTRLTRCNKTCSLQENHHWHRPAGLADGFATLGVPLHGHQAVIHPKRLGPPFPWQPCLGIRREAVYMGFR